MTAGGGFQPLAHKAHTAYAAVDRLSPEVTPADGLTGRELTGEHMGIHARIERGYISIDTPAWLARRTGGPIADLTDDLVRWGHQVQGQASGYSFAWEDLATAWRYERGYVLPLTDSREPLDGRGAPGQLEQLERPEQPGQPGLGLQRLGERVLSHLHRGRPGRQHQVRWSQEPDVIAHVGTRLDTELWIARGLSPVHGRMAIVIVNDEEPVVYSDTVRWSSGSQPDGAGSAGTPTATAFTTTGGEPSAHGDSLSDWYDADTVQILCPGGHTWTWRTGRELLTADGRSTTLTVVFGLDLDAPFSDCPRCQRYRDGEVQWRCGCDGSSWIICPQCGGRCDVDLPPLPGPSAPPLAPPTAPATANPPAVRTRPGSGVVT